MPDYNFDWQSGYRFAEPVLFNPGDNLHIECEYDNSGSDVDVNWGDGTDDEMCLGVYYITAVN